MSRERNYSWWACHHGMPTDPLWIVVARRAGNGATPGHVCAIWAGLLDHASQARPRGDISTFEAETLAESFRWPVALVEGVIEALEQVGRIAEGRLTRWDKRQPKDPTGADRQARKRARDRAPDAPRDAGLSRDNHGESVTQRDGHRERGERRESLSERTAVTSSDGITSNNPQLDARASAGDVWALLQQAGIPAGIVGRIRERTTVNQWIASGITPRQLTEAITRAQQARNDQQDHGPLNVGFVDACLRNPRGRREHGFERGDSAVDTYLARSR